MSKGMMTKGGMVTAWADPQDPQWVYVPGKVVPEWVQRILSDRGYDAADPTDLERGLRECLREVSIPARAVVPIDPAPEPAVIEVITEAGALALSGESIARQILTGGGADALIAVGRLQAMAYVSRITDYATAQTFEQLRASRAYRGLPYTDESGQPAVVSTLDQFCAVYLGKSLRRCQQLAANLHILGDELYEAAEDSGFRARDYAALRALPADDQEAVRAALASDDKDQALTVLADLVARQSAEKQSAIAAAKAAEAQTAEVRADYDALTGVVGEKEAKIRKLQSDRLKRPATLDENTKAWSAFVAAKIAEIRHSLAQIDQVRLSALEFSPPVGEPDSPEMGAWTRAMRLLADQIGLLAQVQDEVGGVLSEHDATLGALAYGGADALLPEE